MALIKSETQTVYDLSQIQRGDCIRIRRAGDTTARNGFVTEAAADRLVVLYCNVQNNATSYLEVLAADVAVGAWEIYWTTDFQDVKHEPPDTEGGETGG
ncbi:MAG: DUF5026 domain-containing protein [Ruminococcus flavefaciens]|nr:DUF5026 domain-containing protein [Ruminococcus flavefaciens]